MTTIFFIPSLSDGSDWMVSTDENGDFASIQAAVDAVPSGNSDLITIFIANGIYNESLEIPADKRFIAFEGESREHTIVQWDQSFSDQAGRWVAEPVVRSFASDVTFRSLTLRNLAGEPGGSGGKWDSALASYGDRLVLDDVILRADHDTLLVYGSGGIVPNGDGGRYFIRNSLIQGRGDFIASFGAGYILDSVIETIRDRGHFVFQMGIPGAPLADQSRLVIDRCTFTGVSTDPVWPAGLTNLHWDPVVYFIDNVMEYDVGVNRPPVHFHSEEQTGAAWVFHSGNASSTGSLDWSVYSVPGPLGTPRVVDSVHDNAAGEQFVQELTVAEVNSITPQSTLGGDDGWDPESSAVPAATTRVLLALPGESATIFSRPLDLPPGSSTAEVELVLFSDQAQLTGFNIELDSSDIPMASFEFNEILPGMSADFRAGQLSVSADAYPAPVFTSESNPVLIGTLTLDLGIQGGEITLGGSWLDDTGPSGVPRPFDNAGAKLAFVPEPRQWLVLCSGVSLLWALGRSGRRFC
jgi:hypothetical protein